MLPQLGVSPFAVLEHNEPRETVLLDLDLQTITLGLRHPGEAEMSNPPLARNKSQTVRHPRVKARPPADPCSTLDSSYALPPMQSRVPTRLSHCSDCEVDLVEHLPVEHPALAPSEAPVERVWCSDEQESCIYVCAGLSAAGIPFKITQRKDQVFRNEDGHYESWLPTEFCDKAKAIAEQGCFDFSDGCEDQKIMELPDAGPGLVKHDNRNSS